MTYRSEGLPVSPKPKYTTKVQLAKVPGRGKSKIVSSKTDSQIAISAGKTTDVKRAFIVQLTVWTLMMIVAIKFACVQMAIHFFVQNGSLVVSSGSLFLMLAIMATFSAVYCTFAFFIGRRIYMMLRRESMLPGQAELTAHVCLFVGIMGFLYGLNWG